MRKWLVVGIALPLLWADVTPALAQARPFRGLFGDEGAVEAPQTLDLTLSLFGVEDNDLPQFRGRTARATGQREFFYYTDVRAGLWYTRRGRRVTFAASGASALQHYPEIDHAIRSTHAGAVGITVRSLRTTVRAEQQLRYSPYHRFRVIPVSSGSGSALAEISAPDPGLAVSGRESYQHDTELGLTHRLTRLSSLTFEYHHEYIDFREAGLDWRIQDARVGWSRDVTRNAALVVGYGYHRRDLERETLPVLRQNLSVGLTYNNALQFSPRTSFSFWVAPSVISNTREVQAASTETTFVRLIGQATLEHQLSRTWNAAASYERGLQYVEGISDVFFADSAVASIGGYLGRRVDIRASAGYSTGGLRFSRRERGYNTQANTVRVRVAISRNFAAQAQYMYYRFLFSDAVTTPSGIAARQDRQVFRVGLTTWFPLLP